MNKDVKIKVNTSVGETDYAKNGEIVMPGGVDAGVISTINIDNVMIDEFEDIVEVVKYVDLPLQFQLFMNIGKLTESVKAAQEDNDRKENLLESNKLELNMMKANYL